MQDVEGILPRICKNLLLARKKAKKEMALTDDPVIWFVSMFYTCMLRFYTRVYARIYAETVLQ